MFIDDLCKSKAREEGKESKGAEMWKGPWMLQTIQVWSQKDGKKLCGSKKDLSGKAEE